MRIDISQRTFNPAAFPRTRKELFYHLSNIGLGRFQVVKEGPRYAVLITGPKPRMCATAARTIDHWCFEGWARACLNAEQGFACEP